jgi:hypothetical protein
MSKFFTQAEKDRRDAERTAFVNEEARRSSSSAASPLNLAPHNRGHTLSAPTGQPASPLREIYTRSEQYENSSYYTSGPQQQSRPAQHSRTFSGPSLPSAQSYTHPNIPTTTSQPSPAKEKEADSPYKTEMVSRMDSLKRGERILPPCDRCRRLHMDCVKNLTACQGCTKKHAKCSWRDVRQSEVFGPDASKLPIPVAEPEADGEREPSVGFRPDEKENSSPQSTTPSSGVFAGHEVPRTLAMEGITTNHSTSLHATSDPMHHHLYSLRYDSGQNVPSRTDEDTLSHVERAAATAAAAVSHSDGGVFGERRDGNPPVVA